jgi:hypothetical protein
MSNWVKCTRSEGDLPIFVNMAQVQTISQEAADKFSTLKFNAGFIQIKEAPERLLQDWYDATPGNAADEATD